MYSFNLLIYSASVRSIPCLSFIVPIFAWNIPSLSLILLKRSLVFTFLLFSSISLHWSLRKAFFLISSCYSLEPCIQMGMSFFILCLLLLFFSKLFVRPPQANILPFSISFSFEWSWCGMYRSKNEDHRIQPHQIMANTWKNNENSDRLSWAPKSL